MTAAEAQQSSGVELDGEAKAELHRSVDRHADKALVAFGLLTEQQRAVLGQEAEQVEWRVWELKASAVQTFGGADSERHMCVALAVQLSIRTMCYTVNSPVPHTHIHQIQNNGAATRRQDLDISTVSYLPGVGKCGRGD